MHSQMRRPHTPAKDSVLLFLSNKKADKTFVDRDEVVSMLRGTTHIEPELRVVARIEVRNARFVPVPLGLSGNGDWPGLSTHSNVFCAQQPALG